MILVKKALYEAKDPSVHYNINDADVLTITDLEDQPIYILELKVSRK